MKLIVVTSNHHKKSDLSSILSKHGLKYEFKASMEEADIKAKELIETDDVVAVIREQTKLLKFNTDDLAEIEHLERVSHSSKIDAHYYSKNILGLGKSHIRLLSGDKFHEKYSSSVDGFIDLTRRETTNEEIYDWDDIFVVTDAMRSYQEMKRQGIKCSAREKALDILLYQITTFKDKVDLNFNPMDQDDVVSFSGDIYDLIEQSPYLSLHGKDERLRNLMSHIKQQGLFVRSSKNKQQRNYWMPGLNAGIPLVPKRDEIHEATFMFHDLMHFAMPDLVFIGEDSKSNKESYIIHRMMSEAVTIVLSDMVFIDQLVQQGIDYDWTKRKIHPVYAAISGDIPLKDILWANISFALLGDKSPWKAISDEQALDLYFEKYEKFFIEDYRWTARNYDNMAEHSDLMSSWYCSNVDLFDAYDIRSVSHYFADQEDSSSYALKVEKIFEAVWEELSSKMSEPVSYDYDQAIGNGFRRYMLGQMLIFNKYQHVPGASEISSLIRKELSEEITQDRMDKIRGLYDIFLQKCVKSGSFSSYKAIEYGEMFPVFDPFYVFYDRKLEFNCIEDVVQDIFD